MSGVLMKSTRLLQGLLIITCLLVPTTLYRKITSKYATTNVVERKNDEIVMHLDKHNKEGSSKNEVGMTFQGTKVQSTPITNNGKLKVKHQYSPNAKTTPTYLVKNSSTSSIKSESLTSNELEFRNFKIPIVIFCSYRPAYMERLIKSLKAIEGLSSASVCLFACQKTPVVSTQDVKKTKDIIANVKFCKAKTFLTESNKRNAKEYKRQWYNIMRLVFESSDIFDLGYKYQRDVLFLEDDIELSKDALKAIWFMLKVKNSNPNTIAVGLGGWSGEHLVNPHPDTFVIRIMLYFPGMAYSFNASIWQAIYHSKFLASKTNDWSEAIAWMWPGRHNVVVPTLGRMWHIGERGLGKSGDGRKRRILQAKPGWLVSPRLMNLKTATVNSGVRDVFGMYCDRKVWQKHLTIPCLCPDTKKRYPNQKHFSVVCVDNPIVYDKCISRDP